ncbi:hypothetical protein [Luteolibacter marinus]|uniref:hypothetical protein n=1 Tax=Luteolibacter marinus TaxID=2776705 RepID=UPI0018668B0F|nr:hypothetical protein [Luteolibacter marinus]
MKTPLVLTVAVMVCSVGGGSGEQGEPEGPKRLGASVAVLRDGGSRVITIPAHGDQPSCKVVIDHTMNSKTNGEMFREEDFTGERAGKQLSWAQADKLLKQLEQVLIAHYGTEELLEIALNPIEPGAHVSVADFGERMGKDPVFTDRLEARYLMDVIMSYRARHGPLLKGK